MSINIIIVLILSIGISVFVTSKTIKFSKALGFGDDPSEKRKIHKKKIPNLGGIAVFIATIVPYFAFSDYADTIRPDKLFSISIFLFFIGVKDDMEPMSVRSRILFEFICALFIIYITDIRLTTLWGIFGIQEIHIVTSYILTSLFIVGCINAYNFIDGIDGLLVSLTLYGAVSYALVFHYANEWLWTLLCVSMAGALIGFLIYNWSPAKIFMGNGGALFLGTMFACFALRIMQLPAMTFGNAHISAPHTMAISVIAIPIVDMIFVVIVRLFRRHNPFKSDNRHIHHNLLKIGFNHAQSTLILVFLTFLTITFAYFVQDTGALRSLLLMLAFVVALEIIIRTITRLVIAKKAQNSAMD
ncbi:UDP-GlcNAc:undecaprenyl-phosphate GlcNAc-1-phosphate transferase [Dysgonomonadaceae bacterium PH5-43]|nr:UDP-GlcNAc:undecaprenyl-phosphate GlcNAc-1-phosphate transferase [Dysgonomonadaceae bacterium PH5-43]